MKEKPCLVCGWPIGEHVTITMLNYGRKHPSDGLHEWYRVCPAVKAELRAFMEHFSHGRTTDDEL